MTRGAHIGRVVALLRDAGYEVVDQPRSVAGIPFEFDAMLVGVSSLDLIVVVDIEKEHDRPRLRGRVEGLARALDLVRSRRSVTLVLVGARPEPELIRVLSRVCRVLLTPASPGDGGAAQMRRALAVLLPLEVAAESDDAIESWTSTRDSIAERYPDEARRVLAAAGTGVAAVQKALGALLSEPFQSKSPSGADEAL